MLSNLGSIPSVSIVLESLRGLVQPSANISTGTGASIVKEKDIKTRRTFLGTWIEIPVTNCQTCRGQLPCHLENDIKELSLSH